eukprot:1811682-Prymnesium_polylepis.1
MASAPKGRTHRKEVDRRSRCWGLDGWGPDFLEHGAHRCSCLRTHVRRAARFLARRRLDALVE